MTSNRVALRFPINPLGHTKWHDPVEKQWSANVKRSDQRSFCEMGRSRLQYRSKHRGTLSNNSRDKIREAHQQRKAAPVNAETVDPIALESEEEYSDDLLEACDIDLLEQPALYVRDSEFDSYVNELRKTAEPSSHVLSVIPACMCDLLGCRSSKWAVESGIRCWFGHQRVYCYVELS